jgi:hypothetical protein
MVESVPGEMKELKEAASRESKQDFWSMCQYQKLHHGWTESRCIAKYQEKFGVFPKGLKDTPKTPDIAFDKFVKHSLIKYLRGKGKK